MEYYQFQRANGHHCVGRLIYYILIFLLINFNYLLLRKGVDRSDIAPRSAPHHLLDL